MRNTKQQMLLADRKVNNMRHVATIEHLVPSKVEERKITATKVGSNLNCQQEGQ